MDHFTSLDTPGGPGGVKVVELFVFEKISAVFWMVAPPGEKNCFLQSVCSLHRVVVPEGARGAMVPPDFGRSVNPILTMGGGAVYAHHLILTPPDFQTFLRHCYITNI